MFERFTERARQIVPLAQEEARALKHNHIGTEHILLGLLREEEGLAGRILESLGITVERVRVLAARTDRPGETHPDPGETQLNVHLSISSWAKKVLELALREALSLGQNYIGTEHILLGLARETDSTGARILQDLAGLEKIRDAVIQALSVPGYRITPREQPAVPPVTPANVIVESYHVLERVPSHLVDMAVDLVRMIQDRKTDTASFEHGYHRVEAARDGYGTTVAFLTRAPQPA